MVDFDSHHTTSCSESEHCTLKVLADSYCTICTTSLLPLVEQHEIGHWGLSRFSPWHRQYWRLNMLPCPQKCMERPGPCRCTLAEYRGVLRGTLGTPSSLLLIAPHPPGRLYADAVRLISIERVAAHCGCVLSVCLSIASSELSTNCT